MNILVFNGGSSSLTFKLFETQKDGEPRTLFAGKLHRIGVKGTEPSFVEYACGGANEKIEVAVKNHKQAAAIAIKLIKESGLAVDGIGHRFVHGGRYFHSSAAINDEVMEKLGKCVPLAPIHNPISLSVIREAQKSYQDAFQFVTFDAAFHATIPEKAYAYPLPKKIVEKFGFRKYGFHGLSYQSVLRDVAAHYRMDLKGKKIVACHLGTGGSSVTAIESGRSIDTSMGFSPLSGLIMSTRSGDIDPMLMIYICYTFGLRPDDLLELLEKKSGLLGVSGFSSDIRDILKTDKNGPAYTAVRMCVHRIKKYIGNYIASLKGLDLLVFTDDIGVQNHEIRKMVCKEMEWCGVVLDQAANRKSDASKISELSEKGAKVRILSVPNKEELMICLEGIRLREKKS